MGHTEDTGKTIPTQSLFLASILGATHSSRHWLVSGFFAERHLLQPLSLFLLVQPENVIELIFVSSLFEHFQYRRNIRLAVTVKRMVKGLMWTIKPVLFFVFFQNSIVPRRRAKS